MMMTEDDDDDDDADDDNKIYGGTQGEEAFKDWGNMTMTIKIMLISHCKS